MPRSIVAAAVAALVLAFSLENARADVLPTSPAFPGADVSASAATASARPAASALAAPGTPVPPVFAPIAFLVGTWSGTGNSDAGAGTGGDAFTIEDAGNTIVRRSHATYPKTATLPASTYDSMMMFYHDAAFDGIRADYVDAAHAIHYTLAVSPPHIAQFVSDLLPSGRRFRLTYIDAPDDKSMHVVFEMAPEGTDFTITIARGILMRTGS